MNSIRATSAAGVIALLMLAPTPLLAAELDDDVPVAGERDQPTEGAQVFEPAYFERYSPRSALDMLSQVPGFDAIPVSYFPVSTSKSFGQLPGVSVRVISDDDADKNHNVLFQATKEGPARG